MDQNLTDAIQARYSQVLAQIAESERKSGRAAGSVKLLVVTKTHPVETVRAAIEAGIRELGENYAEEAAAKVAAIGPVDGLTWHMIGHVQSRKADLVAQNFDWVHSLDSLKLANRLDRFAGEAGRRVKVLLECNVGGEESKFGYSDPEALFRDVEQILHLSNLEIHGLMTMPPLFDDPELSRPFFARLRELADLLSKRFPPGCWDQLSMGTSADFTVAVAEGATIVRVGTAIFGARPPKGESGPEQPPVG